MRDKGEIRKYVRSIRESQDPAAQWEKSLAIFHRIRSLRQFSENSVCGKNIALYYSHKGEVNLGPLKDYFLRCGARCFFPVTTPEKIIMEAYDPLRGETEQCRIGAMGILEPRTAVQAEKPEKMDWIFIPGIAYDLEGGRIGYGKGYYDRYLSQYENKIPLLIAPAYDFQIIPPIKREAHDIPVDLIVTESRIIPIHAEKLLL